MAKDFVVTRFEVVKTMTLIRAENPTEAYDKVQRDGQGVEVSRETYFPIKHGTMLEGPESDFCLAHFAEEVPRPNIEYLKVIPDKTNEEIDLEVEAKLRERGLL